MPEPETDEFGNGMSIVAYLHCGQCLKEVPDGVSPSEYADNSVGWTIWGGQVWCNRHQCNVVHIDFEGHKHSADVSANLGPKLEVVQ